MSGASTLERVQKALGDDGRFSAWQVTHVRGRSTQRYDVFGVPEARRVVETETVEVRVHVDQGRSEPGGALIGESSFIVDVTSDIKPQLDAALSRARLVKNKRWTLPKNDPVVVVDACDPRIVERASEACDEVMGTIARALPKTSSSIRCCAAEAFCDFRRVHLVNSLGLDRAREDTSAYVEYVLLAANPGGDETETYSSTRARRLPELDLEGRVHGDARAVSLALSASTPETGVVDVVLTEQGIEEIYDAFVAHASGAAAYEGWSRLVTGKPVIDGDAEGEALTLTSDPTLPGGLGSFAFDDLGLPGRKVDVVAGGVFAGRPLDQKHACWLDQPATSSWGNVVVASGARSQAELLRPSPGRPLLHLSRFSQLSPHPTTGAFSGEIRLGFVVDGDGKDGKAIRGGSITGNVFEAFRRAWFSTERTVRGRLHAPRALRLDQVSLTWG